MKQFFVTLVFTLTLLLPASASDVDIEFSILPVAQCVAGSDLNNQDKCVGLSSIQCQESESGGSTVGMGFCIESELKWWDAQLNEIYAIWVDREKTEDARAKAEGWGRPNRLAGLKEMQRKWIPYRDALCEHEATQWGGGTGAGPAYLACLLDETARQNLVLRKRLANYSR